MRDDYEFTIDPKREPELLQLYCEAEVLGGALASIMKRHGPQYPLAQPPMEEYNAAVTRMYEAAHKRDGGGELPPGVFSLSMFRSRKGKVDPL